MRLSFGDCTFDVDSRLLTCAGAPVHISGKAFQLLEILLRERPNPVTKETLFERLWPDTFVSEANLATLVKEIRAAIGDDARNSRFIRTVHRFGYAFSGETREVPSERKSIDSVAVLPFANLTDNPEFDYLADGIAEDLINALTTLPHLRVTPRGTAFRHRDRESDLAALAKDLGAQAIVTGRMRLRQGRLNLQVELIDAARHAQIWGDQFEHPGSDVLRLQEELAERVAAQLRPHLEAGVQRSLARRHPITNEAYQLYLRGRHHWNRRTHEGIERGIFYFQRALERDKEFALAWSGLADSYIALASRDLLPPRDLFPKAEEAARRALELDPLLAEAHASVGAVNELFRWDWVAAERSFREAIRLNAAYITARQWYALALAHRGRSAEALDQLSAALEVDPLSWMLNTNVGVVHYLDRAWAAATDQAQKALEINPHYEPAHHLLGLTHQAQGHFDAARVALERSRTISSGEPHAIAALGSLEADGGNLDAAATARNLLEELAQVRYVSPVHFAIVDLSRGLRDEAAASLEQAMVERSGWLIWVAREPRFDAIRDDARVRKVLGAVGVG